MFGGPSLNSSPTHHQFNSKHQQLSNQIEHKKIFCAYHPTEFLTNFCLEKQCLMPLCPTCVVEHTEQHYEANQKPTYVNLHDALIEVRQRCYSQIGVFQECHRVNDEIINYIEGLRHYIKKQMTICKQSVFDHVNILFEEYENTLFNEIKNQYQSQTVYDSSECLEVRESILDNIESLYDKAALLKGDQCLSTLIKYLGQDQEIVEANTKVIKEYLDKNKGAGGIQIGLREDVLADIVKDLCENVVSLKAIHEKDISDKNATPKSPKKTITISSKLRSPYENQKDYRAQLRRSRRRGEPGISMSPFKERSSHKVQRDSSYLARSSGGGNGSLYH